MTGTKAKPQRVGSSANGHHGGMFGAIAILAALYQEARAALTGPASASGCSKTVVFSWRSTWSITR